MQRHEGVRTDRYKLVHFYRLNEWELYDLHKDPDEMQSVYADPAYAHVMVKLKAELARLRKRYKVTGAADREYDQLTESRQKERG